MEPEPPALKVAGAVAGKAGDQRGETGAPAAGPFEAEGVVGHSCSEVGSRMEAVEGVEAVEMVEAVAVKVCSGMWSLHSQLGRGPIPSRGREGAGFVG